MTTRRVQLGPRVLRYCEEKGWPVWRVEQWIRGRSRDLWGCIDYLALDSLPGVLGIQVTTTAHVAERVAKCKSTIPPQWLEAGNRLEVWGWSKRGPRGKRKLWTLKRVPVSLP